MARIEALPRRDTIKEALRYFEWVTEYEWVVPVPFIDIVPVVIQFARLIVPHLFNRGLLGGDVFPYCFPVVPRLPRDLTGGHPLVVKTSYHQKVLHF